MTKTQQEKRRFPRVRLHGAMAEVVAALGAQVRWPNLESSAVLDLSYKGFAVHLPGLFPLAVQARIKIEVQLGGLRPFAAEARVAWCNLEAVGLEVAELSPAGHLSMGSFLRAKLLGSRLQPVSREHFRLNQTFSYWFQAANTHVFVWLDSSSHIERVSVERDGEVVEMRRGARWAQLSDGQHQALLVLSQMDNSMLPMEEFVRSWRGDSL